MIVHPKLPVNTAHKELNDLLELIHPDVKLNDRILAPDFKLTNRLDMDELAYFG